MNLVQVILDFPETGYKKFPTHTISISESEINSGNLRVCVKTHYKELLRCASGEVVLRSCDRVAYYDERDFWTFEVFMLILSLISFISYTSRQKVLNKRMLQRVQRQLANSV